MSKILILMLWMTCIEVNNVSVKDRKIRTLIIDGFSNHDWPQTSGLIKSILETSGLVTVDISTIPIRQGVVDSTWKVDLKAYDVVIQNTNNIDDTLLRWPRHMEERLEEYIVSGGGLYVFHSANNAFPHWEAYNQMIGLGWRSPIQGKALRIEDDKLVEIPVGEGRATYHGARQDEVIVLLDRHPINHGYPSEWQTPDMELYKYARGPANNLTVLSYATDEETGYNWLMEWVVAYGKGRVYSSSMGHLWKGQTNPEGFRCVGFRTTMIRVVEWLARASVSYPIPEDFPDALHIRLVDSTDD